MWFVIQGFSAKFSNFASTMEQTQGIIYLVVPVFTIQIDLLLCNLRMSFYLMIDVFNCMPTEIIYECTVGVSVCSIRQNKESRVLKVITPHSLRVIVIHALLVAEQFPHFRLWGKRGCTQSPTCISTCPSTALLSLYLPRGKKKRGGDTTPSAQSKQQASNNANTKL